MSEQMSGKRVLTGVKPTNNLHIGNYYGAIKPAITLSKECDDSMIFIADYHSLITIHKGQDLNQSIYEMTAAYIASGLDVNNTCIYKQSDIPEILEIAWVLNCFTPKGLMNRAHAYKAKIQLNEQEGKKDLDSGVSMGLYSYPVLMASDILSFNADIVPIGPDQKQHIEITRDIAQKFNQNYKADFFKVPDFQLGVPEDVPGLDGRKMSKSYNNHIPLFMDSKKLRKKVMKITTDSTPPEAPKDPESSIVMDIYKVVASSEQVDSFKEAYAQGISWGEAKQHLFECLDKYFEDKTQYYNEVIADKQKLDQILKQGAEKARSYARPLLQELKKIVGVC